MVGGQCNSLDMALDKIAIIVGQRLAGAACVEVIAQRGNDERLEVGGGNAADRSGRPRFLLQHGWGDEMAVARAPFICRGGANAIAPPIKEAASQERG